MTRRPTVPRGAAVGAACLLLLAIGVAASGRDGTAPAATGWPAPEELDSLGRYLRPVGPAPRVDDYAAYLPAESPPEPTEPPEAPSAPRPEPGPRYTVSAILLAEDRPLAIVDDQPVHPGSRLPGGEQVVAIEKDQVVIRDRNGSRRTLRLSAGHEED